jgi:predicted  nucleic acid-binding Zn-ribbon protein
MCLKALTRMLNRHRKRRDEDLQGRPARPEAETARAKMAEVKVRRYADRTKEQATPRRCLKDHQGRKGYNRRDLNRGKGCFGNPRWMRAEGVTPFGISRRG